MPFFSLQLADRPTVDVSAPGGTENSQMKNEFEAFCRAEEKESIRKECLKAHFLGTLWK